jgi:hypothetical protein
VTLGVQDVERILRDVLTAQGVHVSAARAERLAKGWRVSVTDVGGRVLSTDISAGSAAVIRASVTRWVLTQD